MTHDGNGPMRTFVSQVLILVFATLLTFDATTLRAQSPHAKADEVAVGVTWPFFAFDNGVGRDKGWRPNEQAKLTSELGYDGIGYSGVGDLAARLAACDAHDQRVFSYYEAFVVGSENPITPSTLQKLPQLQGRDAIVWIHVQGKASDEEAVRAFRSFADQADVHGVRVALYPHHNTFVETSRHALELAKAVNRKNFGMSINLCHELKADGGDDLVALVKDSIDHLFLVSINGADHIDDPQSQRGWSRLIQPLGAGDFDPLPFLNQLRASGYAGPIGLQCYLIPGETEVVLKRSMDAWRALVAKVGATSDE